jgi:hypothetical protein
MYDLLDRDRQPRLIGTRMPECHGPDPLACVIAHQVRFFMKDEPVRLAPRIRFIPEVVLDAQRIEACEGWVVDHQENRESVSPPVFHVL